jgi:uncharacterized damage-inducible protein DinB
VNLRELLVSPLIYLAPEKALEGLDSADAERKLGGTSHSVSEIVAHLTFWQDWFYSRCKGSARPMISSAAAGWPAVESGSWLTLRSRFLDGLGALATLAEKDPGRPVNPAIEFPPLANYTLEDVVIHVAAHNAHHLGQVIVLRQWLGAWPPPSGSWTW